ncbi:MAG: hypothetical protein O7H41_20385 [Planctomycetota bacterium]|nr:hypothetical protein [Planctomycetota bacterium]
MGHEVLHHTVKLPPNEAVRITALPRSADLIVVVQITPLPHLKGKPRGKHPPLTFVIPDPASRAPGGIRESILLTTFSEECKSECGINLDGNEPFIVDVEISNLNAGDGKFTPLGVISGQTTDSDSLLPTSVTTADGEALVTFERHGGNGDELRLDPKVVRAIKDKFEAFVASNTEVPT